MPLKYFIVNTYDHNENYFTQGLIYYRNNILIQNNGLYNKSSIIFYNLGELNYTLEYKLDKTYFGEGISLLENNKLLQLTWKENKALSYNLSYQSREINYIDYEQEHLENFNM